MKNAKEIALCGMLTAVSVVILLAGGIIGLGTYAAPMIAGLCLLPVGVHMGRKIHALLWLAVSLLSFLLVPDVEESLMYLCIFGCYPILYPLFSRLPKGLRIAAKLVFFNLIVIAAEALLMLLIMPEVIGVWTTIVLLLLGNATFIAYDLLLPRAAFVLERRLGRLFHK